MNYLCMNFKNFFQKTVTQGMDGKVLQVIQINIWIKEFFYVFFFIVLKAILELQDLDGGLYSLKTL